MIEGNLARDQIDGEIQRSQIIRQTIDGKILMMAAGLEDHATVAGNIYRIFANYLHGKPCRPYMEGPEVRLSDTERYIPDVYVLCDRDKIRDRRVCGAPDLVVEVLSRSTARYDRGHKMRTYARHGVREYWLADPRTKTVEQYLLREGRFELQDAYAILQEDEILSLTEEERDRIRTSFPCGIFPDLTVSLDEIFYDMID